MSCIATLSGIARDCGAGIGGIVEVLLANLDDVTAITKTSNEVSAITMAASAKFKKYTFRRQTGSMTSTLNVDAANGVNYVATDVALQFNRMDTTKRTEMIAMSIAEMIAIVKDADGKYWLVGDLDHPVTATAGTGETGTAYGDANKYTVTLNAATPEYPIVVDPDVIEDIL